MSPLFRLKPSRNDGGRPGADMRKQLFDYDEVLNTQRNKVYATRRQALRAQDLGRQMREFATRTADDILEVFSMLEV